MNKRHLSILTRFHLLDLWNSRVILVLLATWIVVLTASFGVNIQGAKKEIEKTKSAQKVMTDYYQVFPNANFLFGSVYTVQRPPSHLSFIAQGTSFMAPSYSDYLPRYSPNFYYPDDANVIFRLSRPFDLTIIAGVIGALITLILTYRAVNGEFIDNNFYFLELSGVSASSRFFSKLGAFFIAIVGTFIISYIISLLLVLGLLTGAESEYLSTHWKELCTIGLLSALIITCYVSLGLSLSAWTLKPHQAFSAGIAIFLIQVFVTPLVAVEVQPALGNAPPSATELQEKKIHFSRLIHRRVDPYSQRLKVRSQGVPLTPENLKGLWKEDEKTELFIFANNNSNFAMVVDREFFSKQAEYARSIINKARWLSPYFSFQTATAELADNGLESEKLIIDEISWNHFAKYRRWFWDVFMAEPDWSTSPSESKWIFAKGNKPHDSTLLGVPQRPSLSYIEKMKFIWPQFLAIIAWTILFVYLGWRWSKQLHERRLQ